MLKNPERNFSLRILIVMLFSVLAIAGIGFSLYLIYISHTLYMYILSISFTFLALISGIFNIFASTSYYRSYFYDSYIKNIKKGLKPIKRIPTVAVIMPVYNEKPEIVEKNLLRLLKVKYEKNKVKFYLSDNSTNQEIAKELKLFCKKNKINYVYRTDRKGFKAGTLNNALKHCKEEFVAIFDYDEYLTNLNFLNELIPYFTNDKKVAYIQTEKNYAKRKSLFSQSIALFDAFFFKFIQQARALDNTAIFAGSCGIIRKSVLDKIGGFPEFVIEDTFFSFISDIKGYKGIYIPKVYATGKPIVSFSELSRQQWRYNYGDTQFLSYFYNNKPKKLSMLSHIDYLTHGFGLNYISGVLLLFTFVSVLIVFSPINFISLTATQFFESKYIGFDLEIFGSIAFALSLAAPIILTKVYFNSIKKGIMIFLLNFSLAVIRTKAAIASLLNKNPGSHWNRVDKTKNHDLLFAISNTKIEFIISLSLLLIGSIAIFDNNLVGGIWLFWYATLYMTATAFFYKYG